MKMCAKSSDIKEYLNFKHKVFEIGRSINSNVSQFGPKLALWFEPNKPYCWFKCRKYMLLANSVHFVLLLFAALEKNGYILILCFIK